MESEMKSINDKLDDQKDDFGKFTEKLDGILVRLDKKYAAKWVEKLGLGSMLALIAAFITIIVHLGGS